MGVVVAKTVQASYSTEQDIKNLFNYIAAKGKNQKKEKVDYIGAKGLFKEPEKAATQILKMQKHLGNKGSRKAYHIVVSFGTEVKNILVVRKAAKAIAEEIYKQYSVFYAIHTSTENLHIHFAINAVSYVDNKKWHKNKREFKEFLETIKQIAKEKIEIL